MPNKRTIEYQEREIKECLSNMSNAFFSVTKCHEQLWNQNDDNWDLHNALYAYEDEFKEIAMRLYFICSAYIEDKRMSGYFEYFKKTITPFYASSKKMLAGSPYFGDDDYISNNLCTQYWVLLSAFPAFDSRYKEKKITKSQKLKILENILQSTAVIINEKEFKPTNEAEVYNAVKIVCEAAFPNVTHTTESFQKMAKCYKPDILLPALGCAVEYKYATTSKELTRTVDEILIDVKGYDNHKTYKQFYAVFYVKTGAISPERFKALWKEKRFPDNWKGILVAGL